MPRTTAVMKSVNDAEERALAQAGLDLFLGGFVHDATTRSNLESRFPGIAPNLGTIAEEEASTLSPRSNSDNTFFGSSASQIIVIIGGPVVKVNNIASIQHRYGPGKWLTYRIQAGVSLYEKILKSTSSSSHCYVVPTGGDAKKNGIMEAEVTRNCLIEAGIPPHHIVMDCIYNNTIDNINKLIPILRHLHITNIHVVTSEFHIPRVKHCFNGILAAVKDMEFTVKYHEADDGISSLAERAERDEVERNCLDRCIPHLKQTIARVKQGNYGASHVGLSSSPPASSVF